MPVYTVHINETEEIEADNDMEAIAIFNEMVSERIKCSLSDCQYTDQQELEDRERDLDSPV